MGEERPQNLEDLRYPKKRPASYQWERPVSLPLGWKEAKIKSNGKTRTLYYLENQKPKNLEDLRYPKKRPASATWERPTGVSSLSAAVVLKCAVNRLNKDDRDYLKREAKRKFRA